MNKRGQGLSVNTIILIILGVVVLTVMVIGFIIGWDKITPWISTKNVDNIVTQCNVACSTNRAYEYCNVVREIKGLDAPTMGKLEEPFLESSNMDEELNYGKNSAKLCCNTLENMGYFSCNIDCSYLKKQELEKISEWNPPLNEEISEDELIDSAKEFEEIYSTTLLGSISSYSGDYFSYNEKLYSELKEKSKGSATSKPLIIILGDVHGTPSVQRKIIQDLKEKFNINLIGIEGWAGKEVDKKRGYMLLNGEENLIKSLLDDSSYEIIPLKDEKAIEIALKSLLVKMSMFPKKNSI